MLKKLALIVTAALLPSVGEAQVSCQGNAGGPFYAASFNWGAGITYVDCYGAVQGNDNGNQTLQINSTWSSYGTFTLLGSSGAAGNGPFTAEDSSPLTFDQALSGYFALTLKQANYFSVYLLYAENPVQSVNWDTRGVASNGGTNDPGKLSHAVLYAGPTTSQPSVVTPEPSAYLLMSAGLMGLFFVARRSRKS